MPVLTGFYMRATLALNGLNTADAINAKFSESEKQKIKIKVCLYSGSQRTYISDRVGKFLNLEIQAS